MTLTKEINIMDNWISESRGLPNNGINVLIYLDCYIEIAYHNNEGWFYSSDDRLVDPNLIVTQDLHWHKMPGRPLLKAINT